MAQRMDCRYALSVRADFDSASTMPISFTPRGLSNCGRAATGLTHVVKMGFEPVQTTFATSQVDATRISGFDSCVEAGWASQSQNAHIK